MTHLDNLLEECLEAIDSGESLENVIQRLPAEAAELIPLLRLAVVTHAFPHPSLAVGKARAQRNNLVKYARSFGDPGRKFSLRFALVPLALVMSLLLLASIVTVALAGPAGNRYATLTDVSGIVEISDDVEGLNWHFIESGDRLRSGQLVRTRIGSQATLVFFEGTRTVLEGETEVALQTVRGGWNQSLRVVMHQNSGVSSHSVVPLRGANSRFIVETATGRASVRGTSFNVAVDSGGASRFAVMHGVVEVAYAESRVVLTAGQATLTQLNQPLEDPAYEFSVQGAIAMITGDQWAVGGVTFLVPPALVEGQTWQVGDLVKVRGRMLEDGSLVADRIELANNDHEKSHFTGIVDQISSETWVISGKLVLIDPNTEIEPGLEAGDAVEVSFVVLENGGWLAKEIQSLEGEEPSETQTPPAPSETPEVSATPDLTGTPTPEPSLTPTPRPTLPRAGCEVGDYQHPEALTLAERYGVSYVEIMAWFCDGYGFGEIDLAYELAAGTGRPVDEIFAMRESGQGWGQVKKELEPEITTTPHPSKTPRPTKEVKPTKEDKPTKEVKPTQEDKPTKEPNPNKP